MSFLRTVATITAALGTAATANAAQINVLASTAIRSALQELAPQFEKPTGNKLVITYGTSLRLQQTIEKGEAPLPH